MKIRSLHCALTLLFVSAALLTPITSGSETDAHRSTSAMNVGPDPEAIGWVLSRSGDVCSRPREVCADWIDQLGMKLGPSCCIPLPAVGTQNMSICPDPFFQMRLQGPS